MIYILLIISLFVCELIYFKLADKFNIIDKPNERSSHSNVTLRGGGIIFYLGLLFYFNFSGFQYPWFFLGLSLITFVSFADDIKPRTAKFRLIVHFIALLLMFYQWSLMSYPWYYSLIALVLCTGILNAYNFMDGINGITGAYSLVVAVILLYINSMRINFVDNGFIYCFISALLVFNYFNFRTKAKCFAGDVGSISAAFIVLFFLGKLIIQTNDVSYIMILSVYGVDTVLTIIHRIILKENIFEPHRKHLFQLLANELRMPHLLVSSLYLTLQALIALGILFVQNRFVYSISMLIIMSGVYLVIKIKYYHLHKI